jgi:hypothetical protein
MYQSQMQCQLPTGLDTGMYMLSAQHEGQLFYQKLLVH